MRILHIAPGISRRLGGPTSLLRGLVPVQRDRGHSVTVVATDLFAESEEDRRVPGAEVRLVPLVGPGQLGYGRGLRQAIRAAVGDAEYAALLGRPRPRATWERDRPLTRDDIIAQTQGRGGFAGFLHGLIDAVGAALMALGRPHAANNTRFVLDLPFRSVARMSGGRVDEPMLDGLLLMVNGGFLRGAVRMASAWRARRRSERASRKN